MPQPQTRTARPFSSHFENLVKGRLNRTYLSSSLWWDGEWDNVGGWSHWLSPADDSDIVGDDEWSVVWVSEELVELLALLGALGDGLVVGAGKSGDGAWVVGAVSSADTVAHGDESGSAEVGSESLHRQDVWLGVGLDLITSDDVGGAGACCGDNGSENLK